MIYLFKTHYSIGKGVIQANDAAKPSPDGKIFQIPNLVDIVTRNSDKIFGGDLSHSKNNKCFVVDDSMAGIWPIYKTLKSKGISLVFGLRINFVSDASDKSESGNISAHKNIIFAQNEIGYKKLIKISTKAHVDFFHEIPRIDYHYYHSVVNSVDSEDLTESKDSGLVLAVPFYDSFLYNNKITQNQCVPDFRSLKPAMFVENNDLPVDAPLQRAVVKYAEENGLEVVNAQTVYYENQEDAIKYLVRRCMNRERGKQRTVEKPELPGFGSDGFCINKK